MRNRILASSELACRPDTDPNPLNSPNSLEASFLENQVCLFGPERYEPRYDYPLVLWLHSCQSSEGELEGVMPELSLQNYVGCAPRGPVPCNQEGTRYRWGKSPTATAIAEEIVFESIELACAQFSVERKRIFLAGFGVGGTMAWRIALRYPQKFAGVISISGEFPNEDYSLANLPDARSLPMLWLYGEDSDSCGIEQVCKTLPVLHAASLAVDIRQYPCGTELLANMLADANSWLMERVTQQPAETAQAQEESFSRN